MNVALRVVGRTFPPVVAPSLTRVKLGYDSTSEDRDCPGMIDLTGVLR
jgi:hypothetical protein